jgi:hypothetical protein
MRFSTKQRHISKPLTSTPEQQRCVSFAECNAARIHRLHCSWTLSGCNAMRISWMPLLTCRCSLPSHASGPSVEYLPSSQASICLLCSSRCFAAATNVKDPVRGGERALLDDAWAALRSESGYSPVYIVHALNLANRFCLAEQNGARCNSSEDSTFRRHCC